MISKEEKTIDGKTVTVSTVVSKTHRGGGAPDATESRGGPNAAPDPEPSAVQSESEG